MEEENILQNRKEAFFNLLKRKDIIIYLVLFTIIIIGTVIRAQPLENFKDVTTGKYITMELDSEIYLRYAKYILEKGSLPEKDMMRNYPLGASNALKQIGLFTSYFVAYLYKFLHIFIPSITIEYVDIIYPLLATVIITLCLFLLLKRIFNWKVGLLACLFLNLSPPFLFRSLSSDHDILIMMFGIISLYIYIEALERKKALSGIFLGSLAGLTTFLGACTGGAIYVMMAILGLYTIIELLLNKLKKNHSLVFISWIICFTLLVEIFRLYGGLINFLTMMMTFPAYFALVIIIVDYLIFKRNIKSEKFIKIRDKLKEKIPEGLINIIITFILSLILIFVIFGQNLIFSLIHQITISVLRGDIITRWSSTVAENKRPYVIEFFYQFGTIYIFAVLSGAILLFYKLIKPIQKYKNKLIIGFSLFLFLFFFARYSPSFILNGENLFSKFIFFGSIILFSIYLIYNYIRIYKEKSEYGNIKKINSLYVIILIWFLIMVVGALSAIRFTFEFTPITTILASFCFVEISEYLILIKKNNWIKLCGFIIIGLILFSPFSFAQGIIIKYYTQTNVQAKYSSPGYNYQWQLAGKWARENTPEDSVFTHWWDYGYWVQNGFERTTITDGGNFIVWWNYLTGRHVLTAQTLEEPLKFLYAHNASYLLIINDEIGKYGAFSLIGSNESYDRFATIPMLGLDPNIQETRNETLYFYRGGFTLNEDLIYKNELFPKGIAGVAGVILPIKESIINGSENTISIGQPTAVIVYNNKRVDIPLKCVFLNGKKEFDNGLNACLMLIPVMSGGKVVNPIGAAYYLFGNVKDSLFTRLYLFNEENNYFKKVYSDESQIPIMNYNGRSVGPLKIWKISYPDNIKITPEEYDYYLRIHYPDPKLSLI